MCDIFQSTESSRFFVYCEVSVNLFFLSYTLTVLTRHNSNIFDCPYRCSWVIFCCCCLSQEQIDGRFPKWKIPPSESLFYMHTSFNKHLFTCPVVKPQTAFPKKQRSSKFCKTPVQKCSRGRWRWCHSLLCTFVGCRARSGANTKWDVWWEVGWLLSFGKGAWKKEQN